MMKHLIECISPVGELNLTEIIFLICATIIIIFILVIAKQTKIVEDRIGNDKARSADEFKIVFEQVSHELKTPIAIISGHIELLSNRKTSENVVVDRNSLEEIYVAVQRFQRYINFRDFPPMP